MRIYKWDIAVRNQKLMSVMFTEVDENNVIIDSEYVLANLAMRGDIDYIDYEAYPENYAAWRRNSL